MATKEPVTYFGKPCVQFPESQHDDVPIEQFLVGCDGVVHFIALLGTAFMPVRCDVSGNVERIRKRVADATLPPTTLKAFVEKEMPPDAQGCADESSLNDNMLAILWLGRALLFVRCLLDEMIAKSHESKDIDMSQMIQDAYQASLAKHHGFIARQLFKMVLLASPSYAGMMRAVCASDDLSPTLYKKARCDTESYMSMGDGDTQQEWTEQRLTSLIQPLAEADTYAADVQLPFRPQVNVLAWHEAAAEAHALCVTYATYCDLPPLLSCELARRFVVASSNDVIPKVSDTANRYNELDGAFFCKNVIRNFRRFVASLVQDDAAAERRDICAAVQRRLQAIGRIWPHSVASQKNGRRTMEDRHVAIPQLADIYPHVKTDCGVFAVFDGHGGVEVANYAATHFAQCLSLTAQLESDPLAALTQCFETVDKDIVHKCMKQKLRSGCTAVVSVLRPGSVAVAWAGDSHCVLVGRSMARTLTKAHSPHDPDEHERVERAGGVLMTIGGELRVQGVLNLTRSLGDVGAKPVVISEPDVVAAELQPDHEMLVLACDGVYDVFDDSSLHAALYEFVNTRPITEYAQISEAVVRKAKDLGSTDNLTCITVFLKPLAEIWPCR